MKTNLSKQETVLGWGYLAFQLLLLPSLLYAIAGLLPVSPSPAEQNFAYFLLNFLAVLWIFQGYLQRNLKAAMEHPIFLFQAVILGLCAYFAMSRIADYLLAVFAPDFSNANDAGIAGLAKDNLFLTFLGTVVLVPTAEECFFRGLIFRRLCSISRPVAYIVSTLCFAAIHIIGFLGTYTPGQMLCSLIQYLPAGVSLAWSYAKSGSIFAPIVIHTVVNCLAFQALR